MSGLLGLGPVPETLGAGRVEVRQPGALLTGFFLTLIFATMAVTVLHDPGEIGSGGAFVNRWVFGALVVPAAFGIHRFLFRPRIVVDAEGVRVDNAFSSVSLPWADVADARSGGFVEVVGTDGDCARALVYGPAFSGPLTRDTRPRALVALIRTEAARRAGRAVPDDYSAAPLIADDAWAYPGGDLRSEAAPGTGSAPEAAAAPVIQPRASLGLGELAAILAFWTLACAVAAALA